MRCPIRLGGSSLVSKTAIAAFASFVVLGWSQDRARAEVRSKPSLPVAQWDAGVVEGRTYKNGSVGLELTTAPTLKLGAPELKGDAGSVPFLTVAAWGEEKPSMPREGTIFYADAYYPADQRSTEAYMRKVIRINHNKGLEPVGTSTQSTLSGIPFTRIDFKNGPVYEAVWVKACDAQALVFIFTGSDRDVVNELVAATELKLDLSRSGCSSKANDRSPDSAATNNPSPASSPRYFTVCTEKNPPPCATAPRAINSPNPEYSEEARRAKIEGTVVLGTIVSADGRTHNIYVAISLGHGLDEQAIKALREWTFEPGMSGGVPVPVLINVKVDFRLR
jgi:TonB family protein